MHRPALSASTALNSRTRTQECVPPLRHPRLVGVFLSSANPLCTLVVLLYRPSSRRRRHRRLLTAEAVFVVGSSAFGATLFLRVVLVFVYLFVFRTETFLSFWFCSTLGRFILSCYFRASLILSFFNICSRKQNKGKHSLQSAKRALSPAFLSLLYFSLPPLDVLFITKLGRKTCAECNAAEDLRGKEI